MKQLFFLILLGVTSVYLDVIKNNLATNIKIRNSNVKYHLERSEGKTFMEIIGVVSGMMGIYDFLTKTPGISDDQIKQGFNQVQQQLNSIQNMIDQTISLIVDTSIRNQYVTTERVITESLRCYNAYTSMSAPEDLAYWEGEFLKWGSFLRESVSFLLDGMLGRGIIAGDILQAIVITYKSPGKVQERVDDFMGLINTGLYLHGAYVQVNNISEQANSPTRQLFSSSYDDIAIRVENTITAQEDESNVENEMSDLMTRNSGMGNEQFLSTLYEYLADRYDTKWWFAIVYDPISGFDNHCLIGEFHVVFRVGNKNAASISYLKSQSEWNFDPDTRQELYTFPCDNYNNAQNLVEALPVATNRAAVKRLSGLFGMTDDAIELYWKNCKSETAIALPLQ